MQAPVLLFRTGDFIIGILDRRHPEKKLVDYLKQESTEGWSSYLQDSKIHILLTCHTDQSCYQQASVRAGTDTMAGRHLRIILRMRSGVACIEHQVQTSVESLRRWDGVLVQGISFIVLLLLVLLDLMSFCPWINVQRRHSWGSIWKDKYENNPTEEVVNWTDFGGKIYLFVCLIYIQGYHSEPNSNRNGLRNIHLCVVSTWTQFKLGGEVLLITKLWYEKLGMGTIVWQ